MCLQKETVCGIWINGNYKMAMMSPFIDCSKVYYDVLEIPTLIQSRGKK